LAQGEGLNTIVTNERGATRGVASANMLIIGNSKRSDLFSVMMISLIIASFFLVVGTAHAVVFSQNTTPVNIQSGVDGTVYFDTFTGVSGTASSIGLKLDITSSGNFTTFLVYDVTTATTTHCLISQFKDTDLSGDINLETILEFRAYNPTPSSPETCVFDPNRTYRFGLVEVNTGNYTDYVANGTSTGLWYKLYGSGFTSFDYSPLYISDANLETRFTGVTLTDAGARTVDFDVEYYLSANEIDITEPTRNPTMVRTLIRDSLGVAIDEKLETIDNQIAGTSTVSSLTDALPNNSSYSYEIRFYNVNSIVSGVLPFPETYILGQFDITSNALVDYGNQEVYDVFFEDDELRYQECSLSHISGCLSNAFIFLFVPSGENLNELEDFNSSLEGTFPFAYAYDMTDTLNTLYNSPQTATTTVSVPFLDDELILLSEDLLSTVPFASTIKTIIGALLWLFLAMTFYRRTLTIFNSNPQTT
jgi:hypothetical protein